jgi:polysaccharide export outer membrane protein
MRGSVLLRFENYRWVATVNPGRYVSFLCATLLAILSAAPAWTADAAPAVPPAAATPATPATASDNETPATSPVDDNSYRIGPGDTIQVFVWRNPDLTVTVPVRPDGQISTPLAENIVAVGKTPANLARDMEKVLSEYVRSPKVNIIVTVPMSTFSQVKVIGQVGKPQSVPFREGLTVLDVVLASGGLGQFSAGNRAKIVRSENGKDKEIKVRLEDLLNKGDMKQNVAMRPGDVLVVPQSRF